MTFAFILSGIFICWAMYFYFSYSFAESEEHYARAYFIKQVCDLNPEAKISQDEIIAKEFHKDFMSILNGSENCEPKTHELTDLETEKKSKFIRILYRVAIADDGIKDDEWDLIDNIADNIGIPAHVKLHIQKYYEPVRRGAAYEKQKEQEQKSTPFSHKSMVQSALDTLGVSSDATIEEIEKTYRQLALLYHPDLPKNAHRKEECEEKMKAINIAYEEILNMMKTNS